MRILLLPLGRALVTAAALRLSGGVAALTHPISVMFLVIEAAWSTLEGLLARAELGVSREERVRRATAAMTGPQRAFVMAGKQWFLVNLLFQVAALVGFGLTATSGVRAVGPRAIAGALVYVCGAGLRGWSMRIMGDRFKSWGVVHEARGLATTGPYGLVRHPSYLGLLLMALAVPIVFGVWWLLPFGVVLVLVVVRRVKIEESLLRDAYAHEYADYARSGPARLIPGVW